MKILLLGEYSNVHWTLASGLRALGHEVVVVSSGDSFKSYRRDISLARKSNSLFPTLQYLGELFYRFSDFKGFDVVQIINPIFIDLKAQHNLRAFKYLKRNNDKVFLGAFGNDHYWVKTCLEKKVFRYSEFDIPGRDTQFSITKNIQDNWLKKEFVYLNEYIADSSNGIIACLYEYFAAYQDSFKGKTCYIPAPINVDEIAFRQRGKSSSVNFFIGIQKERSEWKGTDVMLKVLTEVCNQFPNETLLRKAVSVPFAEYMNLMNQSDVLLDQLYSYTPAMNALSAMAQGLVVVGGGEPECYEILQERELQPIINVFSSEEDLYQKLVNIIINKNQISELSNQSRLFIERHHDYHKVAQQYLDFWTKTF